MTDLRFQNPPPTLPKRQIKANVKAAEVPHGWTAQDDVALVEGLFLGLGLGRVAAKMGKKLPETTARFLALRNAATGGAVMFTLDAQTHLLDVVRERAG